MRPDPRFTHRWPTDGCSRPQRTRSSRPAILTASILAVATLTSPRVAQIPLPEPAQASPRPAPTTPQNPERQEHSYQGGYSLSRSHELFRACDANSDDRLDILETTDAFDMLGSAKDHPGFARFDTDRDGFVTWPEFDQRFRKGLEHGGTFRVRTSRPFVLPDPPPQPLTPLQKFMRLHDKDGDGSLSPSELTDLLKQHGLPLELMATLMQSDRDLSKSIDEIEFAPVYQALGLPTTASTTNDASGLRQPWLGADADANQAIDPIELGALLRRLDPALLRWTKNLIEKLDKDRDGKLSAAELEATKLAEQAGSPAKDQPKKPPKNATKPAAKPAQTPER